ncbi:MAG: hypothetical protein A2087_02680 [Spirochaetes bacterium GWD1_61_31]|nr:MAG: hypothetical protein A2Y37_12800 [Spirochaetes bacterium GWB1_60_80]OHD28790.1 MAG: hypothetical protein A2004_09270 [Spirochaetes bacterium GWC1_61_12]OHD43195.1 MAG: hypothetical protein A2Y35_08155 [Spirochaetes bacterium GWE1_60_18]OHD44171.1 MAG: hypothetical protein A2087_02680 [Spirochaetes bacterium GWD1_61_31]OHD58759.1 MAG: hypothetical protein A2Y32_01000 [Spirochaetes bacterium GWF1_60_12]HAP42668.1 hypothetical protein [Spirochaetaceae bacterium]
MAVKPADLPAVLDYILNRAPVAELEVVAKALERRRQDAGRYEGLGGLSPAAMAERMAGSINQGIEGSMDSLRRTVRKYVEDIIRRQAPEASDLEVAALLDHYVGQAEAAVLGQSGSANSAPADGSPPGLVDYDGGDVTAGLPPDAVMMMVRDFADYSLGLMPPSRQKELWDWMPRWQDKYWISFDPQLKSLIKARLENRLAEDAFWQAVFSILGL